MSNNIEIGCLSRLNEFNFICLETEKIYEICVLKLRARLGSPFYPPPVIMEMLVRNTYVSAVFETSVCHDVLLDSFDGALAYWAVTGDFRCRRQQ